MGLRPLFTEQEIGRQIDAYVARLEKAVVERLRFIGEKFIEEARSKSSYDDAARNNNSALRGILAANSDDKSLQSTLAASSPSFKDRTTNLRSSIGYAIYKNGDAVETSFPGSKADGKEAGKALSSEVASTFPTGIVLVVVAGMEYAAAVESLGYDVITGSSLNAEKSFGTFRENIADLISRGE